MLKRLKAGKPGEGYIDVVVLILCAMLVIGFAVKVLPVFIEIVPHEEGFVDVGCVVVEVRKECIVK